MFFNQILSFFLFFTLLFKFNRFGAFNLNKGGGDGTIQIKHWAREDVTTWKVRLTIQTSLVGGLFKGPITAVNTVGIPCNR